MADKKLNITIMPDEIMGTEIVKSGEFKFANVAVKRGENEHLRISYEWKGAGVPEFVMGLMSWMQANKDELEASKERMSEEYTSTKERM